MYYKCNCEGFNNITAVILRVSTGPGGQLTSVYLICAGNPALNCLELYGTVCFNINSVLQLI